MDIKKGDKVRKQHAYDGTRRAGVPEGPVLTVLDVRDNHPVDGSMEKNSNVFLSDGSLECPWNLTKVQ